MKLTLHIGQPKAGSTSIQDNLFAAREEIRAHGCLFPDTLFIPKRHHWLLPLMYDDPMKAPSVVHRMGFSNEAAKKAAKEEWEFLLNQLEGDKPDHLIMSTEVIFFPTSPEEQARAKNFLPTLTDDVQVMAYVRSPVSRYLSRVQQSLKSTRKIFQPEPTRVAQVLASYEEMFNRPVKTRVFERSKLKNQDAVDDFIDWASLPIPMQDLPNVVSNESVSPEAMAVLSDIMPLELPNNEHELNMKRKQFRSVLRADKEIESPTKPKLNPEIAHYITASCSELPILRDKFGLEFSDIDYSLFDQPPREAFEITEIGQICPFNEERKALVLNRSREILANSDREEANSDREEVNSDREEPSLLSKLKHKLGLR